MPRLKLPRRVVIVDDSRTVQALLDNAFSKRSDFQVVGLASDATTAGEMIRRLRPDIVTIDLCMPYLDGAALLEIIRDLPGICKIVVSDRSISNLLMTAKLLEAGASACLGKSDLIHDSTGFFKKINAAADSLDSRRPRPDSGDGVRAAEPPQQSVAFPVPADESQRLSFIHQRRLANAHRERQFDLVTKHIAKATAFPASLLTIIDRDTQWIKSAYGLDIESTPRHQAFCNYTISQGGTFIVTNTATDDRFSSNPAVTYLPSIKCYAGHPVLNAEGVTVASLCVIDTRIRTISSHIIDQLAGLSEIVGEMIDKQVSLAA